MLVDWCGMETRYLHGHKRVWLRLFVWPVVLVIHDMIV
jgi:hypothetical protein